MLTTISAMSLGRGLCYMNLPLFFIKNRVLVVVLFFFSPSFESRMALYLFYQVEGGRSGIHINPGSLCSFHSYPFAALKQRSKKSGLGFWQIRQHGGGRGRGSVHHTQTQAHLGLSIPAQDDSSPMSDHRLDHQAQHPPDPSPNFQPPNS